MKHKFLHNWLIIIFIVIILLIIGGILFLNYWTEVSQTAKHDSPRIGQPSHNLKIDGRWRKKNTAAVKKNGQQFEKEVKRLQSLGYLQGYHNGPTKNGVTLYNKSLAYGGLNFFTSGHAQAAFLMDMQGKIIHQWDLKNPLVKKRLESIIKSQDDPKIRVGMNVAVTAPGAGRHENPLFKHRQKQHICFGGGAGKLIINECVTLPHGLCQHGVLPIDPASRLLAAHALNVPVNDYVFGMPNLLAEKVLG